MASFVATWVPTRPSQALLQTFMTHMGGAGVGIAVQTYIALGGLNILGLYLGVLAFGDRPGCCRPEAPPPAPRVQAAGGDGSGGGGGGVADAAAGGGAGSGGGGSGCSGEIVGFFRPFCHGPFMCEWPFHVAHARHLPPAACIAALKSLCGSKAVALAAIAGMFILLSVQAVGGCVMVYFTQYFLKDVVATSPNGFR